MTAEQTPPHSILVDHLVSAVNNPSPEASENRHSLLAIPDVIGDLATNYWGLKVRLEAPSPALSANEQNVIRENPLYRAVNTIIRQHSEAAKTAIRYRLEKAHGFSDKTLAAIYAHPAAPEIAAFTLFDIIGLLQPEERERAGEILSDGAHELEGRSPIEVVLEGQKAKAIQHLRRRFMQ